MSISAYRRATGALTLSLALATVALPGTAHAGFFDQLFGGGQSQPVQQAPAPQPDATLTPNTPMPVVVRRPKPNYEKPVLQKTTDIMKDKTLQPGDAVMTATGIKVYEGGTATKHSWKEFAPLRSTSAEVPKAARVELASMDSNRGDRRVADGLLTGRSAAVSDPVVEGRQIVDMRGATVRYVGP